MTTPTRSFPAGLAGSLRRHVERTRALKSEAERAVAGLSPSATQAERVEARRAVTRFAEAVDIARRVRALAEVTRGA